MTGKEVSKAILVLGMHRSGTSAATRVLSLLGVDLGGDLIQPAQDNVKGFWEHRGVLAIHEQLLAELGCNWQDIRELPAGWLESSAACKAREALLETLSRDFAASTLWAVKEPRLCRLLPLWLPLAKELNVHFHALHISRHPDEVAGSLRVRNGMSLEHTRLLWMQHVVEAHAASRDLPRAVLHFDELLSDWREGVSAVAERLHLDWPKSIHQVAPDIEDFLSPMERHHTITSPREIQLPGLLQHLYDACSSPARSVQWQRIDHCVERCQEAREAMLPGFSLLQSRIDILEARAGAAESAASVLAQRNEGALQALGWVASRLPGGMKADGAQADVAKLYYRTSEDSYSEERGVIGAWHGNGTKAVLVFELATSTRADFLRFDPADCPGEFEVAAVRADGVPLAMRESVLKANQYRLPSGEHDVRFGSGDNDPYLELALPAAGGEVRLVEVECRRISAADELARSVEEVVRAHLEPQRQALQGIQDNQAMMSSELHSLVKAEAERIADVQLIMQKQMDVLDQRSLALLEQMQRGWFGWRRRKP
jgi:hypothetical protein